MLERKDANPPSEVRHRPNPLVEGKRLQRNEKKHQVGDQPVQRVLALVSKDKPQELGALQDDEKEDLNEQGR